MGNKLVTAMQGLLSTSDTEAKTSTSSNGTASAQKDTSVTCGTVPLPWFIELLLIILTEPLFELRRAQGKGLGLFAARSIPRETRIIEESPLLAMPRRECQELTATGLSDALRGLNREQQGKFLELHRNRDALVERLSNQQPQLLIDLIRGNLVDAAAVFVANCVEIPEVHTNRAGVFEHYSRINHACNPNVHNAYNSILGKLTVHAIQQINKGEEILTSYVDGTSSTRQQRQQVLSNWDFDCGCRTCTGPEAAASDASRRRIYDMYQQLAFYAAGQKPAPEFLVLSDSQAALEVAEELLELHKSEGITDLSLAEMQVSICPRKPSFGPC
jgi:hypothetical protein